MGTDEFWSPVLRAGGGNNPLNPVLRNQLSQVASTGREPRYAQQSDAGQAQKILGAQFGAITKPPMPLKRGPEYPPTRPFGGK